MKKQPPARKAKILPARKPVGPKTDLDCGYPRLRFCGRKNIREIATGDYPPVQTAFFTDKGPAVRSIWFDKEDKSGETLIVKAIEDKIRVRYIDGSHEPLACFMRAVEIGQYVLVGTVTRPECETAT